MAEQKLIQSLIRASAIIDCFCAERPELSLAEIAEMVKLNKSTLYGLVKTLEHEDYLIQNDENKKYHLGIKFVTKGFYASVSHDIVSMAAPYLKQLNQKYHEATTLFLWESQVLRCVYSLSSSSIASMKTELGTEIPMYTSASGQILLASLPEDELAEYLDGEEFHRYQAKTGVSRQEFEARMTQVSRQGYALELDAVDMGISSVAVAIRDVRTVIGTISITGQTLRIQPQFGELAENLLHKAMELSEKLGYV